MYKEFLPPVATDKWDHLKQEHNIPALWELLTEPLHEELWRRQTFDLMDELNPGQQLLLSFDYLRTQVMQGGFIQLIQNGYVGLLPDMPAWLQEAGAPEMAQVIDDALKVYVLNKEILSKKTTVEEFALLYNELKEFEGIDERFAQYNDATMTAIVENALEYPETFVTLV